MPLQHRPKCGERAEYLTGGELAVVLRCTRDDVRAAVRLELIRPTFEMPSLPWPTLYFSRHDLPTIRRAVDRERGIRLSRVPGPAGLKLADRAALISGRQLAAVLRCTTHDLREAVRLELIRPAVEIPTQPWSTLYFSGNDLPTIRRAVDRERGLRLSKWGPRMARQKGSVAVGQGEFLFCSEGA